MLLLDRKNPLQVKWALESTFYMNGPSKLAASISSKPFFGLKFSLEKQNVLFWLKSIKFKQIHQA
jgi:hypothetical protein